MTDEEIGSTTDSAETAIVVRPGEDAVFPLRNPKRQILRVGLFISLIGIAPFLIDASDRGALMLMRILGVVLILCGGWLGFRAFKLFGVQDGQAVVTARELLITRPGQATETIALETIERVWFSGQSGQRSHASFEKSDGSKTTLAAANTTPELEQMLGALVIQRAELCRSGVRGREELAAVETYLASRALGERPFGVRVVKEGTGLHVAILETAEEANQDNDGIVFLPSRVHAVLREQSGLANAKPMRGVGEG